MDFSSFDVRKYRVLPVQQGYGEWVQSYDQTVQDEMDLRLLDGIETVPWPDIQCAIDLACGTGGLRRTAGGHGPRLREKKPGLVPGVAHHRGSPELSSPTHDRPFGPMRRFPLPTLPVLLLPLDMR